MREYIIVHHSGAEEKDTAQIKRYHTQSLGWRDIGYNFVIERDGIDTRGYYIVVKQEIEWDGGLSAKLTGRMVSGA